MPKLFFKTFNKALFFSNNFDLAVGDNKAEFIYF